MLVRHITYASPNYSRAARQLRASSRHFGLETFVYTLNHPAVDALRRSSPEIMSQPRGGGYWLWKPAVILDALNRSDDDTIVLYTDAGMHMVSDPKPLLAHTLKCSQVLFEHAYRRSDRPTYPEGHWTKRDCFVLLGADGPDFWGAQQLLGGFQIYRNCAESRDFVREVLAACSDPRVLTDQPNTQGLENLPGFREHRHDQSVLTIVAQKHGLPRFIDPSQHGRIDGQAATPVFDLHRKPDRGVFTKLRGKIWGIDPGIWERSSTTIDI